MATRNPRRTTQAGSTKRAPAKRNLKEETEAFPNQFVTVTWLDACDDSGVTRREMENQSVKDFLVERESYGILAKEDKHGVIILKDVDASGYCEITVIPAGMITQIAKHCTSDVACEVETKPKDSK